MGAMQQPHVAHDAAGSRFIPAGDLTSEVLPSLKSSSKCGGVMLWSNCCDDLTECNKAMKQGGRMCIL